MRLFRSGKILLIVVAVLLLIICSSCGNSVPDSTAVPSTEPTVEPTLSPKAHPADFVLFNRSTGIREVYVPVEEIMAYESQYPDCNGTWFRDQLSGEELRIYNSYLYAMENGFTWAEIYVEDSDKDFDYIRDGLGLDSPFLEQSVSPYEYISKRPINFAGERVSFSMDQFSEKRWEKKMEALAKCREIVAGIPEGCTTQLEKMEYLYNYVCDNVEYALYEDRKDEDYLYDAVCEGVSLCDGYSNMLSLLFNLIGVECCEAMGNNFENISQATDEELENFSCHTWVVAKVDGKFYNFDPTFDSTVEGFLADYNTYFGFSDELVSHKYFTCQDIRPKCTDTSNDFDFADLTVKNVKNENVVKMIAEITDYRVSCGEYVTLLAVKEYMTDDEVRQFLNSYAKKTTKTSAVNASWIGTDAWVAIRLAAEPK